MKFYLLITLTKLKTTGIQYTALFSGRTIFTKLLAEHTACSGSSPSHQNYYQPT